MKTIIKTTIWILVRMLLKIFYIFPIKHNRILFFSYSGKQYSCNPKYISEYIVNNYPSKFEIVWAFQNPKKYLNLQKKGIKIIPFCSIIFLKFFFTSKFIVTNDSFYSFLEKRKRQILIQTWHGGGAYKKVGRSTNLYSKDTLRRLIFNMKNVDLYLSSCKKFTQFVIRGAFSYEGKVLEKGMPRNDFLINNSGPKNKVKTTYGIPDNYFVVLYAPTFRQDIKNYEFKINYNLILETIKKKYSKNCIIMVRYHHKIQKRQKSNNVIKNIIDVSDYPDMQELLYEADILITDYSSSMWDFSLMYKPCFIYAEDILEYVKERNFYTPINKCRFSET